MKIQLSDHFTFGKLLRFTFPSIIMMVFTSIYSVVDGYFVSNFAGQTALAAVNLVFPLIMLLGSVGFMFGSGGTALIAKTLGEGNLPRANGLFSLFVYVIISLAGIMSIAGVFLMPAVVTLIGGEGELFEQSVLYGRIMLIGLVPFALQLAFQTFFVTAGRPQTGLFVILAAGATNMILDWLFVGVWRLGAAGAASATVLSEFVGGVVPVMYFLRKNPTPLRIGKAIWDAKALGRGATNGLSELLSNISSSIVGILFNAQLLRHAGERGVAAYSVLMYVNFVFVAIFLGYAVGLGPIVGFDYGANNREELRNLLKKSLIIILCFAAGMFTLAEAAGDTISHVFVGYDPDLLDLTRRGFAMYSFSFLFAGWPILTSAFFTGLNNGIVSAVVSASRSLVFQVSCVIILPGFFGVDGIWLSAVVAEILATIVAFTLLRVFRKKYGYAGPRTPSLPPGAPV